jgi:hypothetical protein
MNTGLYEAPQSDNQSRKEDVKPKGQAICLTEEHANLSGTRHSYIDAVQLTQKYKMSNGSATINAGYCGTVPRLVVHQQDLMVEQPCLTCTINT